MYETDGTQSYFTETFAGLFLRPKFLKYFTIAAVLCLVYAVLLLPDVIGVSSLLIRQRRCTEPVNAVADSVRTEARSIEHRSSKRPGHVEYGVDFRFYWTFAYDYEGRHYRTEYPLYYHKNLYPEGSHQMIYISPDDPSVIRIPNDPALLSRMGGKLGTFLLAFTLVVLAVLLHILKASLAHAAVQSLPERELTEAEKLEYEQWMWEHNDHRS